MAELSCCQFCGRDTRSKYKICVKCLPKGYAKKKQPHEDLEPWTELRGEADYDYSEDALGPKMHEQFGELMWGPSD